MNIIGLTGGIGSGKSTAAQYFYELGIPIIDLDDISKEITKKNKEGYKKIINKFGSRYLTEKKEINRNLIKKEIFNDSKLKEEFEQLIHPIIYDECMNKINNYDSYPYIIIVIPLLFETKNYQDIIDESLLIDCEKKNQIERINARDKIDLDLIDKIISSQIDRATRQKKADNIIKNNFTTRELKKEIIIFHNKMLKKIKKND